MFSPRLSLEVVLEDFYQILNWISAKPVFTEKLFISELVEINFLLSELFFHVFEATVSPPFCLFYKRFPPISDLIDLARWIKLTLSLFLD